MVEEQTDRAFRLPLKHDTQQNKVSGIPLVLTYNPTFRNLSTTLRQNFNILYSDETQMILYLERTVGSSKCGSKRC